MAKADNSKVIMISIRPEYANAILRGEKKIEFRKMNIPKDVNYVVLYATAPEQKIVGYFSVGEVIEDKPSELWRRFSDISGTTKEFFNNYYKEQNTGLGLIVKEVNILTNPFGLEEAGCGAKPPQSFLYIEKKFWINLKRRKTNKITDGANNGNSISK